MAGRDWFDTLVGVASALNSLVLLVLVAVLVPAVVAFTRSLRQVRRLLDRAYEDLRPLSEHANRIAASVDDIAHSVRTNVKQVSAAVDQASRGLSQAVQSTERRLRDFGALMDVAQEEAERAVVTTASAVRGARAGAAAARPRRDTEDGDTPAPRRRHPARPRVRARQKPAT
jgi:uncharacterized protein YoxC